MLYTILCDVYYSIVLYFYILLYCTYLQYCSAFTVLYCIYSTVFYFPVLHCSTLPHGTNSFAVNNNNNNTFPYYEGRLENNIT